MPTAVQNVHILTHPLIQHKLSYMRNKETKNPVFRQLLKEISLLIGYEITRHLPLVSVPMETPLEPFNAQIVPAKSVAVVPILRAGLGMLEGLLDLVPLACVGHLGLQRDPETKRPVEYYVSLPAAHPDRLFIVADPMIATGHSLVAAVRLLCQHGVPLTHISVMALVVSPEGLRVFHQAYPDIPVYAAALDRTLDPHAYIRPGLGDAGDRLFGTL